MKRAIVLALLLAGCTQPRPEFDLVGNMYPRECHDVSGEKADVVYRSPAELGNIWGGSARVLGMFVAAKYGPSLIVIDNSLDAGQTADTLKHERCHARMYRLYGDSRWHR